VELCQSSLLCASAKCSNLDLIIETPKWPNLNKPYQTQTINYNPAGNSFHSIVNIIWQCWRTKRGVKLSKAHNVTTLLLVLRRVEATSLTKKDRVRSKPMTQESVIFDVHLFHPKRLKAALITQNTGYKFSSYTLAEADEKLSHIDQHGSFHFSTKIQRLSTPFIKRGKGSGINRVRRGHNRNDYKVPQSGALCGSQT